MAQDTAGDGAGVYRRSIVIDALANPGSMNVSWPPRGPLSEKQRDAIASSGITAINVTVSADTFEASTRNIALWQGEADCYPALLSVVRRHGDIAGAKEAGTLGLILGFQNTEMLERDLSRLDVLFWLPNGDLTPFFDATVQATEEAIVNALVAAETMVGINGNAVFEKGVPVPLLDVPSRNKQVGSGPFFERTIAAFGWNRVTISIPLRSSPCSSTLSMRPSVSVRPSASQRWARNRVWGPSKSVRQR